jgi:hypothetical protein
MERLYPVVCAFIVMSAFIFSSGCVDSTGTDIPIDTPSAMITPTNTQSLQNQTQASVSELTAAPTQPISPLLSYKDTQFGWQISYPKGWSYERFSDPTKWHDTWLNLASPDESMEIQVVVRKTADTLDGATQHYVQGMENSAKTGSNITMIKSYEKTTLSGLPAYRFEAQIVDNNTTVRHIHLITAYDAMTYQIAMYVFEEKYLDNLRDYNTVIDSFEISR